METAFYMHHAPSSSLHITWMDLMSLRYCYTSRPSCQWRTTLQSCILRLHYGRSVTESYIYLRKGLWLLTQLQHHELCQNPWILILEFPIDQIINGQNCTVRGWIPSRRSIVCITVTLHIFSHSRTSLTDESPPLAATFKAGLEDGSELFVTGILRHLPLSRLKMHQTFKSSCDMQCLKKWWRIPLQGSSPTLFIWSPQYFLKHLEKSQLPSSTLITCHVSPPEFDVRKTWQRGWVNITWRTWRTRDFQNSSTGVTNWWIDPDIGRGSESYFNWRRGPQVLHMGPQRPLRTYIHPLAIKHYLPSTFQGYPNTLKLSWKDFIVIPCWGIARDTVWASFCGARQEILCTLSNLLHLVCFYIGRGIGSF